MNSFEIKEIKYDGEKNNLIFKFGDNSKRVCLGVFSEEDIINRLMEIIKTLV
jgi:hypothetical protein